MKTLAPVLSPEIVKKMFLPVLVTLKADIVPNVRMNVSKTIHGLAPYIKGQGELETTCRNILKELSADAEWDVKFYAQKALTSADGLK